MANELQYYSQQPTTETGLTVVGRVYNASGTQVGSDVTMTEDAGNLAIYRGNMPTASAGQYGVRYWNGSSLLGTGVIHWDGTNEVTLDSLKADVDALQSSVDALNDITAAEVYTEFTNSTNEDAFKADVSALATASALSTLQTSVDNLNNLSAAQVNAEVDTALADYDAPTNAELSAVQSAIQGDIAGLNNLSAADVNAEVDTALADYDAPTRAELTSDTNSIIGEVQQSETDVIAALPSEPPTAAAIATQIFGTAVEDTETFTQMLRILRAALAGNIVEDGAGNYTIKSRDGLTDRITGSSAANDGRTISATDGS